ncbi:T9SS type A sorting domain-containing protein [Psychroserpens jangbogonensis]|uniref:T9SS type A sorting domain-containing protein n=1 Tax=Psychroserpens jangbogonensis TaxID=1484460 RepID=UPI00068C7EBF|nr:T9SS type A sorting domain-containing protein [Psychroserpens jangbogonensis]
MIKSTLIACLLFISQSIFSQESINASGSEATGSGGAVSYSVGQVFYSTQTGSNGTLSEGVQQPDAKTIYIFNSTWMPSNPNGTATAADDIVIASGDATIDANTTTNTVTINPGAGLIIDPGMTLSTTNGLMLESSSTNYSSLILDGIVTGTLEYERHVNINGSGTTGSNDLISAPLTGEVFSDFATNNPNIFNNGTLYLFGPFEKVTGTFVTWTDTETATLDPGVGFRAASSDNGSFVFNGTANNGIVFNDIINSGSNNEEWNLIGNPYPSYLNVQAFLNHDVDDTAAVVTNLQLFDTGTAAIYGYDGNAQNGWTIYNLANTTASTLIAPGQGFFVSADPTNAALYDLQFTPAMRSTGSGDDFIAGRNAELTFVKLNASTATNSYNTEFYFNANATPGYDFGYDARAWDDASSDFAIYSNLVEDNTGHPIALQTLDIDNLIEVTIPLGVNANQGEQLTFSIADTTLPASVSVYLEDAVANTSTLLNNSDYVISPTTALSGTGRFFLRTSDDALSTIETNLDALNIFALHTSKELVVNGQLQDNTTLALYDIQGRQVLSTELDAALVQNRLDVSILSAGVYVVQLQNNAQNKSQKVIIK